MKFHGTGKVLAVLKDVSVTQTTLKPKKRVFVPSTGVLTLKNKLTLQRLEVVWRDLQAYTSEGYLTSI